MSSITRAEYTHLADHPLPGGHYRLERYENWLAHDALYSQPRPEPHPVMAYVATQRGMGVTVAELFSLLGVGMEDGPLLAGCTFEFFKGLRTETDYKVRAVIQSVERKPSRTHGVVDFVTCRLELIEVTDDTVAAVVTNVYAIPRVPNE